MSYKFTSGAEVSNWFEGLELVSEEGFLSVHDCVGTIMDYPQGCAIVVEVMKKREENSFEGVASQVILTEEVMRMTMKDIPLLEILRKSKAGAEYVRSVNDRLCKIRK